MKRASFDVTSVRARPSPSTLPPKGSTMQSHYTDPDLNSQTEQPDFDGLEEMVRRHAEALEVDVTSELVH